MELVTGPHARTPRTHSQWVVGPCRTPQRTGGRGWESARPRTPHTKARGAPPWGAPMLPSQRATPARTSARCGVGDGSPRPQPPHPQPVGSRPRLHAPEYRRSGVGERPIRDAQARSAPPPAPSCRPHSAQSQLAKARVVWLVTGPHARTPRTHSQWAVGTARKDEWSGMGERPTPDAPHPGKRRPPRAPSCRLQSVQSQLARARVVGLVTGAHARGPRTQSLWVVGPGRTPERTSGRGWESARPRTPHTQARGAPRGHPRAARTVRKASSQERARWG